MHSWSSAIRQQIAIRETIRNRLDAEYISRMKDDDFTADDAWWASWHNVGDELRALREHLKRPQLAFDFTAPARKRKR